MRHIAVHASRLIQQLIMLHPPFESLEWTKSTWTFGHCHAKGLWKTYAFFNILKDIDFHAFLIWIRFFFLVAFMLIGNASQWAFWWYRMALHRKNIIPQVSWCQHCKGHLNKQRIATVGFSNHLINYGTPMTHIMVCLSVSAGKAIHNWDRFV